MGHSGLEKFCAGMNLPRPVSKKPYNNHLKKIEFASYKNAQKLMEEAAKRLIDLTEEEEEPQLMEMINGQKVANVAVTLDGTWQRRGHSSKIGVVLVISVRTGEVLDYEVLSMVCHECQYHEKEDRESEEYQKWFSSHKENCQINYKGSSGEMESTGGCMIFLRSIEKRNLKYNVMVGDGDTGFFGKICQAVMQKYGDSYTITKEECVGHVQKRMGTNLREYKRKGKNRKLADGKGIAGIGRLTDKKIDQMQNYYGQAIRKNKGNMDGMITSINAIFKHMIRNDQESLELQHSQCPKGANTWCKFWKDKREGTTSYDDKKRLPSVFQEELKPLFQRLSSDELLQRCLKGLTQNQNESFNSTIWSICPKTIFCGKRKVSTAMSRAVGIFNVGASSKAATMKMCGISPGSNAIKVFKNYDLRRVKAAAIKITSRYRNRQRELRAPKKSKSDKIGYFPGAFGLSAEPDLDIMKLRKRTLKDKREPCAEKRQKKTLNAKEQVLLQKDAVKIHRDSVYDEPNVLFVTPEAEITKVLNLRSLKSDMMESQ